jgi:hypothetical protein
MKDQFFTPADLASEAINAVKVRRVVIVADFAAGHGDLLVAARSRWPDCFTFGNDLDPACSSKLATSERVSAYSGCDFLNDRATNASKRFRELLGNCDVVLLNPPFSGRGGKALSVKTESGLVTCSRAMAFIFTAIKYLRRGGEIVAILPASCLSSRKDARILDEIQRVANYFEIGRYSNDAFPNCSASTVVVRFRRRAASVQITPTIKGHQVRRRGEYRLFVKIVRGCVPVYRADNGLAGRRFPFIHSTDIVDSEVYQYQRAVNIDTRVVRGPAVLLTRVGSPATKKCAIYDCAQKIVLSDCVIALECADLAIAEKVRARILSRWDRFSTLYGGTCAPYITLDALKSFLLSNSIMLVD